MSVFTAIPALARGARIVAAPQARRVA